MPHIPPTYIIPFILSGIFYLPLTGFSQVDTLGIVNRICQEYLEEEKLMVADSNYIPDPAGKLLSRPMAAWWQASNRYFARLGFNIQYKATRTYEPVKTNSLLGCRLIDQGEPGVLLSISPSDNGWLVTGVNGRIIDQSELRRMEDMLDSSGKIIREKEIIYTVAKDFMAGRNAFYFRGNSDSIAQTVTAEYLEILKIGKEVDQLVDVPSKKFVVRELFSDWIEGDTASCMMAIKNYGNIILRLAKVEGNWKVCGERNFFATPKMISKKREELKILREKAALRESLKSEFSEAVIKFLINDEPDSLKPLSTSDFFSFMEKFKLKFGEYNPEYLAVEGPMIPINLDTKVRLRGDSAAIQNLEESVYLLRENGQWKLAGFNGKFGEGLTEEFLEEQFFNLKFEFQVSYSAFNGDLEKVNLPEPGEDDNQVYHYMTDLLDRAIFPEGKDSLLSYIRKEIKPKRIKNKQKSPIVYLSFIIEKDGSLSEIKVINRPKPKLKKAAIRIVENMPAWIPAMQYDQPVKMYQVLAISFQPL